MHKYYLIRFDSASGRLGQWVAVSGPHGHWEEAEAVRDEREGLEEELAVVSGDSLGAYGVLEQDFEH